MSYVMTPAHFIFIPFGEIALNYVMSPETNFLPKTVSSVLGGFLIRHITGRRGTSAHFQIRKPRG